MRVFQISTGELAEHSEPRERKRSLIVLSMTVKGLHGWARRLSCGVGASCLSLMANPALAQFSAAQDAAFAITVGRPASDLNTLIAAIIAVLAFAGMGWIAYSAYQRWAQGRLGAGGLASLLIRASALIVIAGIFLR